ncbi:formylmethanofuran dehydrogenase [Caballeronia sp. LZ035]|uniref:formylmethanofuran dehydrogenase n=1 Tax=Caballeronia sp. LZ035 TaxID=3038568 RepID=UPI0028638E79|nr:formylmethanofuran dehydrogenase [Caballeronia sp. LZ035]MDR5761714.1 formylmethanofuran dehydrogenase [Caballeronia sp. LZ035]
MPQTPEPESRPAEAIGEDLPWTCPFCSLLCDDFTLATLTARCRRLTQSLAHINPQHTTRPAEINGQPADPEAALQQATEILSNANRPLFSGLATDIAGTRAIYNLAAHSGAILDHLHGDTLADTNRALQDRGAFFTTLSEIRSRADLIVVFACEPSLHYPRFYERIAEANRDVPIVFVGCNVDQSALTPHTEAILPHHDPFDLLALWSAHLESSRPIPHAELAALTQRIHAAHYTAFIFEPAVLPAPHAALAIEALQRIVKAFNRTTRAGALALSGDDGALSVNQAITWLSGFPLRTRVAYGMPLDHDPYRYRTHTLLSRGEVDTLLWVSSFTPEPLPAALDDNLPVIVLGHPATQLPPRKGSTVFIPVATPGIDSGGHLFRIDTSVVARLTAARDSSLPSVATIAAHLTQARKHS